MPKTADIEPCLCCGEAIPANTLTRACGPCFRSFGITNQTVKSSKGAMATRHVLQCSIHRSMIDPETKEIYRKVQPWKM